MSHLDGASVLITGKSVRRIAVFSRDEPKQHFPQQFYNNSRLQWFLGDVRDLEGLKRVLHGVDYVINTAALKQVYTGKYNPMEFITNTLKD